MGATKRHRITLLFCQKSLHHLRVEGTEKRHKAQTVTVGHVSTSGSNLPTTKNLADYYVKQKQMNHVSFFIIRKPSQPCG